MVRGWSTYFVILFEDSSSTLWIRALFCLFWFYALFQGRFVYPAYRRFVSILLVWICPLLPIKLNFMTAYSVTLCEDSSSDLWIHPLFCLLLFYPLFRADSSTLLTGDSSSLFLRLDLFWRKKEVAASTVCLTGFPCHFFWFFPHEWFFC